MKTQKIKPQYSQEHLLYLRRRKRDHAIVVISRIMLLLLLIGLWELAAQLKWIDPFIMSSPSRIANTIANLFSNGELFTHIGVTLYETCMGFLLSTLIGTLIAILLWWSEYLRKVLDPYIVVLNSLPKIALGPVIIIVVGAGTEAIIFMALAISLIVTVLEMLAGFRATNPESIKMARTFGATKRQVFTKIVFPSNINTLFNSLKINIGLSLVGVIAGEFLVSKAGLGYLIVYGGQVFQLDLVMSSVLILSVMAALMYQSVVLLQKFVSRWFGG